MSAKRKRVSRTDQRLAAQHGAARARECCDRSWNPTPAARCAAPDASTVMRCASPLGSPERWQDQCAVRRAYQNGKGRPCVD